MLQQHFTRSDNVTKAIMLTAYCKMAVCYGGAIASGVDQVLGQMATVMDAELQQRAVEYHNLPRLPAAVSAGERAQRVRVGRHPLTTGCDMCAVSALQTLDTVLGDMPPYKSTESVLEKINEERRKELQVRSPTRPVGIADAPACVG